MIISDQVSSLKGVGPKKALALEKLGIKTIEDLLYFFPRDYQDRRHITKIIDLKEDRAALVRGTVQLVVKDGYRYGKNQKLRLLVDDGTHAMEVVFFNAKYMTNLFKQGNTYDFYGKPAVNYGKLQMIHPDFSPSEKNLQQGILPIYPLAAGLGQNEIRKWQRTVHNVIDQIEEYLPVDLIEKNRLCGLQYAIKNLHFPDEKEALLQGKYRLIFDELLALQVGLLAAKQQSTRGKKGLMLDETVNTKTYIDTLSYDLTNAQKKVIKEIDHDMQSGKVMNRLVQGDVGSGKTVVAEIALYKTVKSGFQGVMMAPTEILARQHYEGLFKSFQAHNIKVGILTGSMTAKEKKEVLEQLAAGEVEILVGTHAIIQPNVMFQNLGLVITDEQHRFGVNQRSKLSDKGNNPHVLVMTATPIPRTLAVILYGDLDISIIDELPPGRQKIITKAIDETKRDSSYDFIQKELDQGRQAYVVTPLIEESEVLEAKSAEKVYKELKKRFNKNEVALLHGEMRQAEKDEIMSRFYQNEIHVLVSTVVIEVGINVPNATVMVIENAERFGLAQLHQLRGRIGRGSHQSYCILISKQTSEVASQRAEIMASSQDGFYIAEKDLEIRGPGEIFGTRQHGIPDLNLADLVKHIKVLNVVKNEASLIISEDPLLESEKYIGLKRRVFKLFGENFTLKI